MSSTATPEQSPAGQTRKSARFQDWRFPEADIPFGMDRGQISYNSYFYNPFWVSGQVASDLRRLYAMLTRFMPAHGAGKVDPIVALTYE